MNNDLDNYINGLETLPTPPGVLITLITLFQQPDRDVDEVAQMIRQDPSLTAGVLRHANSAYFVPEEPICDIFDAIAWVGFSQVYQAVVAKLASQSLQLPKGACGIDVDRLWQHSVVAGVCAGAIAKKVQENESLAFTAGLLHDVGKIVLSLAEGAAYTKLTKETGLGGPSKAKAEAALFGFGHTEIGGHLLSRWGLPEEIAEPVRCHHQVNQGQSHERICAVVSLGNLMAHAAVATKPEAHYDSPEAIGAMGIIQLREPDLAQLLQDTRKEIKHMTGAFAA